MTGSFCAKPVRFLSSIISDNRYAGYGSSSLPQSRIVPIGVTVVGFQEQHVRRQLLISVSHDFCQLFNTGPRAWAVRMRQHDES